MTSIYLVLAIYMIVLFAIGIYYSKKNANITDFLLAGRSLGVVAATLTITASLMGGGLLTGSAQYAYDSGAMIYVYGTIGAGGGMALAALLVHKMANFSNYGTITEYLEARYDSKFLRTGGAILSIVALIGILGGQVAAVVGIMNALGMQNTTVAALLAMVVIIALTSMGGLKAVTVTDGFQIILVIFGVIWVAVAALGKHGGISGMNASLASMADSLPQDYNVILTPEHFRSLAWMILPGFMYTMIGQDVYQRLFGCKTHKTAVQASICSAIILALLCALPVMIGLMARISHPELAANGTSSSAFAVLAMDTLPNWAVGIIMAAALSAILSTADSLLSAAASHFMNDFWMLYVAKDADPDDRRLLTVSRIFTVAGGAFAVIISMLIPSILDACFYSYYIFTAGVFCPIVFGVFWKKATRQGATAGLLAGGIFVLLSLFGIVRVGSIPGELFSGVVSAVVLIAVSLATQKKAAV